MDKLYTKEDLEEAHANGWYRRERLDDLSPDIIFPSGLDYEEKEAFTFELWFASKFKNV